MLKLTGQQDEEATICPREVRPLDQAVEDDELLAEQVAYYQARAGEYDEWFLREGRHDRGPEWNRRWFSELEEVRRELGEGRKRSHWMWFVFPQLRGLGRSGIAQRYGYSTDAVLSM